jgi:hypothetical protein
LFVGKRNRGEFLEILWHGQPIAGDLLRVEENAMYHPDANSLININLGRCGFDADCRLQCGCRPCTQR